MHKDYIFRLKNPFQIFFCKWISDMCCCLKCERKTQTLKSFLLYIYFSTGKLQIVYLLLSHNASLNTEDNDGSSTLHHAAKNGHAEVVLELIEAGASIESTDSGDWTPLIWVSTNQINTTFVKCSSHFWYFS